MITVETLNRIMKYSAKDLSSELMRSGYSDCDFKSAEFVGITNGGQFAYKVIFFDEEGTGKDQAGKVFLTVSGDTIEAGY
jgi:uncharacterized protein YprB with RNaseH-like and TPR domain